MKLREWCLSGSILWRFLIAAVLFGAAGAVLSAATGNVLFILVLWGIVMATFPPMMLSYLKVRCPQCGNFFRRINALDYALFNKSCRHAERLIGLRLLE
jgi:hypothetical protein